MAGRELAERLRHMVEREDLVLALPRGGVPIACEIASALGTELDVLLVRKLGVVGCEELAMGAIALAGGRVLRVMNEGVVDALEIQQEVIDRVAAREAEVMYDQERHYRGNAPPAQLADRRVVVVAEGAATGATLRNAVAALRQMGPAQIVLAIPVAPAATVRALRSEADKIVCLASPEPFWSVAAWYSDYHQIGDDEVRDLLQRVRAGRVAPAARHHRAETAR